MPVPCPAPAGVVVVRVPDDWDGAAIALFIWNSLHWIAPEALVDSVTVIDPKRTRHRPLSQLPTGR